MSINGRETITRRNTLALGLGSVGALTLGAAPALAFSNEEMAVAGPLGDKILGQEDAAVTIVEYASMTCPHCANFHANIFSKVKENYVDTGKVRFIYRDFPLDGRAFGAAMLAHCTPADKYFNVLDLFFTTQSKWAFVPREEAEKALLDVAKQAGFTQEKFYECLQNKELIAGVNWVKQRAQTRFGVTSTPTVFVNGELSVAANYEQMAKEIDALL